MKTSKYNFRKSENRQKAVYRLLMYPKPGVGMLGTYTDKQGSKVVVIYGYYNKPDKGLQQLLNLVQSRTSILKKAVIYNKTNLNPNHEVFAEVTRSFNFQ